ncbi:hypothetical protein H257_03230 [Aphanomyces astaci]|uniref:Uncharacterized protein n=1 Tax=Aphanomyces astaci TaxID=112090 RepID=W4H2X1_APHAT|nr:hypothetical protein H257_03230 [Aphanomyces astaci]ETV85508.1 hypothetical protein H257_03230 [Aphanomyces astaci]|eukprot:XP_009825526.1 hypothetical protein H257_03230 [Aphanomyces astaci]
MKKEEQRIDAEHQAAADLVETALRTVGPMAVRELLRNEIVEGRHTAPAGDGAGSRAVKGLVQEAPVGQAAPDVQASPKIKIKDEGVGQMAVANGPLGMREVRLEDVRALKLHEQDDSVIGQLDSRLQEWGWTPALCEPVERYLTLFCRSGLFEAQMMWLVCALQHMTILEIPLTEFVDWKDKIRERISD